MTENQRAYFDNHAGIETLFFTSDGFAFFKEPDAYNHAQYLDDGEVTTITRYELEGYEMEDEDDTL